MGPVGSGLKWLPSPDSYSTPRTSRPCTSLATPSGAPKSRTPSPITSRKLLWSTRARPGSLPETRSRCPIQTSPRSATTLPRRRSSPFIWKRSITAPYPATTCKLSSTARISRKESVYQRTADGYGNDTIKGKKGNDIIDGGAGNDTVKGGKGKDTIYGGEGRDVLVGGKGKDTIYDGSKPTASTGAGDDGERDLLDGGVGEDGCSAGPGDTKKSC